MNATWTIPIDKCISNLEQQRAMVVKKIAFDLFRKVILKTPVLTGRARANWLVSVAEPRSETVDETDKTGIRAIGNVQSVITGWNADSDIYLSNNLPYIYGLERGRSKKAPRGMVKISVTEVLNEH
jgi:hypothetical protein